MTTTNDSSFAKPEFTNRIDYQISQMTSIDSIQETFLKDSEKINSKEGQLGWTPLHRAIICENLDATFFLLQKGADPNIQNNIGETPLYYAVDLQREEIIKILLEYNADPNIIQNVRSIIIKDGDSPLHIACTKQNYKIVELLLKYSADPNKKNNSLRTPVHYGIMHCVNNTGIIYLLVQYGGSLYLKDQQNNTPLDYIQTEEVRKAINILKTKCELENNNSSVLGSLNLMKIESKINHQVILDRQESGSGLSSFIIRKDSLKAKTSDGPFRSQKLSGISTGLTFTRLESGNIENEEKKDEISMNFSENVNESIEEIKEEETEHDESPKKIEEFATFNSNGNGNLNTFANLNVKDSIEEDQEVINSREEDTDRRNEEINIIRERLNSIKSTKKVELNYHPNRQLSANLIMSNNNIKTPKKHVIHSSDYNTCKDRKDMEININGFNNCNNIVPNNYQKLPSSSKKIMKSANIDNKENITPKAEIFKRKLNFSIFNDNEEEKVFKTCKTGKKTARFTEVLPENKREYNKSSNTMIVQESGKKQNISVDHNRLLTKLSNIGSNNENTDTVKHAYTKSLKSSNSSYVSSMKKLNLENQIKRLNEWLNSMNLHIYFDNFLEHGLTNLDHIFNLADKQNKITYDDFVNIGITKPGHVFRLLTRIEYDAGLIQENLNFLLNRGKYNDILKNSLYLPKNQVSCCGPKKSNGNKNCNPFELTISDWLLTINMEHLRKNFSHNGFDSMEYLLMQTFSSYIINEPLLENYLHIYQNKDRIEVMKEIEKNVECLRKFLKRTSGELEYEEEMLSQADCKMCISF